MQGDFIAILPLIQKLRNVDVHLVIKYGNKIYEKFSKVNIQKLAKKIEEEKKIQNEKCKMIDNDAKGKSWNYADLVKNTTNFLYKWMPNQERKLASKNKAIR